MENEPQPLKKILETLESRVGQPTMLPPPTDLLSDAELKQRQAWLDKWLKMDLNHPRLIALGNEVHSFCKNYAKQPSRGHRLIIHGENGTGKSHAAKSIFRWASRNAINLPLVHSRDGQVSLSEAMFFNWPAVVDGFKQNRWEVIEEMLPTQLLVIDDLGAEHDPSKVGIEKLYLILERREHCWTVITTNVAPESWEFKFERRIASRFLRNARHISLADVPDYNA